MTDKAMARPWKLTQTNKAKVGYIHYIASKKSEVKIDLTDLVNMELIIRAVNSFDSLVGALNKLVNHAEERYPHFEAVRGQKDIDRANLALKLTGGKL